MLQLQTKIAIKKPNFAIEFLIISKFSFAYEQFYTFMH